MARPGVAHDFQDQRKAFLDFVLGQYVKEGVGELDTDKLPPLLRLKYSALDDAMRELGDVDQVRAAFVGFQKYLYARAV